MNSSITSWLTFGQKKETNQQAKHRETGSLELAAALMDNSLLVMSESDGRGVFSREKVRARLKNQPNTTRPAYCGRVAYIKTKRMKGKVIKLHVRKRWKFE